MNSLLSLALPALCLLGSLPAAAQVPLTGSFTASEACPALQSIRQQSNPGNVLLEPGRQYRVTGKNRPDPTFFQIVVDSAQPLQRWVPVDCGNLGGAAANRAGVRATHVLALGWEPAFCREHTDKTECRALTERSDGATHLSLHGLWPQPRGTAYCGVDRNLINADRAHHWDLLPEPQISAATRQSLAAVMPGVQSGLQRHEWIVHGTCYGAPADAYFNRAASLTQEANAPALRELFVQHIGTVVTADTIRAAFDNAFGDGAGARVTVSCTGNGSSRRISELVISLAGPVTGVAPLADLIQAAAPAPPGCPSGIVERAAR